MSKITGLILLAAFALGCCDKIKEEADALKKKHKKCDDSDVCIVVSMTDAAGENNCLGPFQCASSMNKKNIDDFKKKARELAKDFEHCGQCAMASCIDMTDHVPFCNVETGLCDAESPR